MIWVEVNFRQQAWAMETWVRSKGPCIYHRDKCEQDHKMTHLEIGRGPNWPITTRHSSQDYQKGKIPCSTNLFILPYNCGPLPLPHGRQSLLGCPPHLSFAMCSINVYLFCSSWVNSFTAHTMASTPSHSPTFAGPISSQEIRTICICLTHIFTLNHFFPRGKFLNPIMFIFPLHLSKLRVGRASIMFSGFVKIP